MIWGVYYCKEKNRKKVSLAVWQLDAETEKEAVEKACTTLRIPFCISETGYSDGYCEHQSIFRRHCYDYYSESTHEIIKVAPFGTPLWIEDEW